VLRQFFVVAAREGHSSSERALERSCSWLFRDVPLPGARVLDIGGGAGAYSFYAAAAGAKSVLCLELEAEGGVTGMNERFYRLRDATGLGAVELERATLQSFPAPESAFDVVLLHNSVNHLDERAVTTLHRDDGAPAVYARLLSKVAGALTPGGHLILADCARTNAIAEETRRHALAAGQRIGEDQTHGYQQPAGDERVAAIESSGGIADVHRPTAPAAAPLLLPEHLGHERVRRDAAGQRVPVLTVRRNNGVIRAQRDTTGPPSRLCRYGRQPPHRQEGGGWWTRTAPVGTESKRSAWPPDSSFYDDLPLEQGRPVENDLDGCCAGRA